MSVCAFVIAHTVSDNILVKIKHICMIEYAASFSTHNKLINQHTNVRKGYMQEIPLNVPTLTPWCEAHQTLCKN